MAAVTICSDFGAQEKKICHCFHFFPIYLLWSDGTRCHGVSFWMLSFKPTFSLSSFTFIKRLFSSSSLSATRVLSSAHMKLLIFLLVILMNAKVGSQETPGVTGKFGLGVQNEAGQRLLEFCQDNALVIPNTLFQQHERRLHMDITRRSTPKSDWLYSLQPKMEKLYTVSKNKTRSWMWLRSWTPYCQIQT